MTTVGIVGAGQLGQMLGYAGRVLEVECVFLDPSPEPPAADAGEVLQFAYDDPAGLAQLAARANVLTYEFENVPVTAVEKLIDQLPVYPPPAALHAAQDRLQEKSLFQSLDIPTPPFLNVESVDDLSKAVDVIGLPLVVKTRRLGYDGKGQAIIRSADQVEDVFARLGAVPLLAEQHVPFDYEVSAIGARTPSGISVTYPLTRNTHSEGILRTSVAPAGTAELTRIATDYHSRLLDHLDYVGVLALELFVVGDELLANEFAPRVHNSGHWTIEGAATSQFENHLRAILGLELGDTSPTGHVAMENLIGELPADKAGLTAAGYHIHDYGKAPRPGRKLGHVTLVAPDPDTRDRRLAELRQVLE